MDKGGDIYIDPIFVILNHSTIKANAWGGPGGNIDIIADYFILSPDSIVEASSKNSTPGEIKIQAIGIDMSGVLTSMDTDLLDATQWQKTPCSMRTGADVSHLILEGRNATPTAIDDFLSGMMCLLSDEHFFESDDNPNREDYMDAELFQELFADQLAETCDKNEKCSKDGKCK